MSYKLNQIGDTIIEVMIAMAVIGLTIGGAYGIANRSLQASRGAQERGEALKLAEAQLERIRAVTNDPNRLPGSDLFGQLPERFCIQNSDSSEDWVVQSTELDALQSDSQDCKDGLYHVSVSKDNVGVENASTQFTVLVQWFQLGSSNIDQVSIAYRVVQGEDE